MCTETPWYFSFPQVSTSLHILIFKNPATSFSNHSWFTWFTTICGISLATPRGIAEDLEKEDKGFILWFNYFKTRKNLGRYDAYDTMFFEVREQVGYRV